MGRMLDIVSSLHKRTQRDYIGRMVDDKVHCMKMARQYEADYWDGDRRFGYGGYKYDGRWSIVAQKLVETYKLPENARILDIGCGKAFLLYELSRLLPKAEIAGFDISNHGLANAKPEVRPFLFKHRAQDPYPFGDKHFDLAISLTTFHNLKIYELQTALKEMERVAKNKYLMVESYRDEQELFNVQCWALTCEAFFSTDQWIWLYDHFGYTGDYEFIYFEGAGAAKPAQNNDLRKSA
ncbi:MAG: class I SAM-dependent methyltransferase [Gemmataceae bacterium]